MFADFYETSALKAANDAELDGLLKQSSSLSPASLKELSVKRATVTPFWWALWIMFRVSPEPVSLILSSAQNAILMAPTKRGSVCIEMGPC